MSTYENVTNTIIQKIESGVMPWHKPWQAGNFKHSRPLRSNGEVYRGINTVILWAESMSRGYSNPRWFTFKQINQLGGSVLKGEKSTEVVYWNFIEKEDADNEDKTRKIPFMRSYRVFNAEQTKGLPEKYLIGDSPKFQNPDDRIDHADRFVESTGANVKHGGNAAFYMPADDFIQMPEFQHFESKEAYYGTITHELTHWTGHKSRVNRDLANRFGSGKYAAEELIAELGAAFLCADLEIEPVVREDHASYIANWLTILKGDSKAIFTAAAAAEKAVQYIHGLQAKEKQAVA